MKKLIVVLLACCFVLPTFAQDDKNATVSDPKAEALLVAVSGKYKSFKTFKAEFTLTVSEPEGDLNEEQSGTAYLSGDQFLLQIGEQEIICDNKTLWTYLKTVNEVQINTFEPSDDMFTPSQIFAMYDERFVYRLKESRREGNEAIHVVELTPIDKDQPYFKIDVTISTLKLQIIESKIYEKSGLRYMYRIIKSEPNIDLPEDFFSFDPSKYPGIEVVDLR